MSQFGDLLRTYRNRSQDPEKGNRLTQERLGEFIGRFVGDIGYTGASVSYWERGGATINQNDRDVLLGVVHALFTCGGIRTLAEANALLQAGDYRALNAAEIARISPDWLSDPPDPAAPSPDGGHSWTQLRRYLPIQLFEQIELAPRQARDALCLPHLNALLRTVCMYLPRHQALALLQTPVPTPQQVGGHFLEGSLLFADISEFTRLTEMLREQAGTAGAEEIVAIINQYLDSMLRILFKYDGRLIKFGGDAMLCLFTGPNHGVQNVLAAAWEMRQAMADRFKSIPVRQEIIKLDMSVGQHAGLLFAATVGTDAHMEYILTGSAVEQTARAESRARAGDIVVSADTMQLTGPEIQAEPLPDDPGFYRITHVQPLETAFLTNKWNLIEAELADLGDDVWAIIDRLDVMVPYLPTAILPTLVQHPEGHLEGQYRQVSVLFANFEGMSQIIDAYGTADSAAIADELNAYIQAVQEEVAYYGGVINKVDLYDQGDKLMVLFGAPQAHERDARRAALTALAMQRALKKLTSPAASFLTQRMGIHSGIAFAGNVGSEQNHRREYTVMGDTVNLAARLMSAAGPEEIWISPEVETQIQPDFDTAVQVPIPLKGIARPITPFKLRDAHDWYSRQRAPGKLRTAMIGREGDLDSLLEQYDRLQFGAGLQLAGITGPGGVGKTRLLTEWRSAVDARYGDAQPVDWLLGAGRSYGQRASGIFIDLLESLLDIHEADDQPSRWRKLGARVKAEFAARVPGWMADYNRQMAYLGTFLGLELGSQRDLAAHVAHLEGEALQRQMWLAVVALLRTAAAERPFIAVLEDLHWADEASLALLRFLIDQLPGNTRILFCLIFRQQRQTPIWAVWQALERNYGAACTLLQVRELRAQDGRALLGGLLQTDALPARFADLVLRETDGNPLYVEEVLYNLIRRGVLAQADGGWELTRPIAEIAVPDTLYQIIQSRIDDLDFSSPGARRVLWLAAILGSEFTEALLLALFLQTGREEASFWQHLQALRNADMLQWARVNDSAGDPKPGYRFRHGLLMQVGYENMLASTRRQYHADVGAWLEEAYANDLASHYDALAYHYDRAEAWDKAFRYHWLVGRRDARTYANESAQTHLQRALTLAGEQVGGAARGQVHYELGRVLATTGALQDAAGHLQTAFSLLTDAQTRARICYEIGRLFELRAADFDTAWAWQARGLDLLPALPTAEAALLHALGGILSLRQGDFDRADAEAEAALVLAEGSGTLAALDFAHRLLSISLRARGRLAEAMDHCRRSIAACRDSGDLLSLVRNLANQGVIAFELDDWPAASTAYAEALDLARRVGDRYEEARALINLADLAAHRGELETAVAQAAQGLAMAEEMAATHEQIVAGVILAIVAWRQRAWDEMAQHLDAASELAKTAVMFQPTVGRWRAQLQLSQGHLAAAAAEIDALLALGDDVLDDEAEPIQRLHGELLAAQEDSAAAIAALEASLARLQAAGKRYQTAQTHKALAEVLTGLPDRRPDAIAHARQALAIFEELGATLDAAETAALLQDF